MSDPALEQLEADLRESRFKPWDVETFLASRHQAKIEALTAPGKRHWQVAREIADVFLWFIGYLAVMTIVGVWLVSGVLPLP